MFDYIRNFLKRKERNTLVSLLNDSQAMFSYGGQNVYLSDHVNNCIDRIAIEVSKMSVLSVVTGMNTVKVQNDEISRLFRFKPNPLQTTKDFLACCEWLRRKDCNCFIYPQYEIIKDKMGNEYKYYTAFWPLNPTSIEIGVDDTNKVWEIKFHWRSGGTDIIPYSDIVHLKWRRGKNTVIGGGSDFGTPDIRELSESVSALGEILKTVPKALKSSLKINGMYRAKTVVDGNLLNSMRNEFEKHITKSESGIIATDLPGEFVPINMSPTKIDDTVMKFLKSIIRERYGISEAMLSGDFNRNNMGLFIRAV